MAFTSSVGAHHNLTYVDNTSVPNGTNVTDPLDNATRVHDDVTDQHDLRFPYYYPTHNSLEDKELVFFLAEVLNGLLIVLINGLATKMMIKQGRTRYKHLYLFNLIITDLLVGLAVPCLTIVVEVFHRPMEFYSCLFINCLVTWLTSCSILSCCSISIDRYISIRYPAANTLFHRPSFRRGVVAGMWIISGLQSTLVPYLFHPPIEEFEKCVFRAIILVEVSVIGGVCCFFLPILLTMLIVHVLIFKTFRRSAQRIQQIAQNNFRIGLQMAQSSQASDDNEAGEPDQSQEVLPLKEVTESSPSSPLEKTISLLRSLQSIYLVETTEMESIASKKKSTTPFPNEKADVLSMSVDGHQGDTLASQIQDHLPPLTARSDHNRPSENSPVVHTGGAPSQTVLKTVLTSSSQLLHNGNKPRQTVLASSSPSHILHNESYPSQTVLTSPSQVLHDERQASLKALTWPNPQLGASHTNQMPQDLTLDDIQRPHVDASPSQDACHSQQQNVTATRSFSDRGRSRMAKLPCTPRLESLNQTMNGQQLDVLERSQRRDPSVGCHVGEMLHIQASKLVQTLSHHTMLLNMFKRSAETKAVFDPTFFELQRAVQVAKLRKHENRLLKSLVLVFVVFFFTWMPLQIMSMVEFFRADWFEEWGVENYLTLRYATLLLSHFNSFCNTVIYCLGNAELRRKVQYELFMLLSCGMTHEVCFLPGWDMVVEYPRTRETEKETSKRRMDTQSAPAIIVLDESSSATSEEWTLPEQEKEDELVGVDSDVDISLAMESPPHVQRVRESYKDARITVGPQSVNRSRPENIVWVGADRKMTKPPVSKVQQHRGSLFEEADYLASLVVRLSVAHRWDKRNYTINDEEQSLTTFLLEPKRSVQECGPGKFKVKRSTLWSLAEVKSVKKKYAPSDQLQSTTRSQEEIPETTESLKFKDKPFSKRAASVGYQPKKETSDQPQSPHCLLEAVQKEDLLKISRWNLPAAFSFKRKASPQKLQFNTEEREEERKRSRAAASTIDWAKDALGFKRQKGPENNEDKT